MSLRGSPATRPPAQSAQKTGSLGPPWLFQRFGESAFGESLRARWTIGDGYIDFVVRAKPDGAELKAIEPSPGLPLRELRLPYEAMLKQVIDMLGWSNSSSYELPAFATLAGFCGHNAVVRSRPRGNGPTPQAHIAEVAQRWIDLGRPPQHVLGKALKLGRSRAGQLLRQARHEGYLDERDELTPLAVSVLTRTSADESASPGAQ